MRALRDAKVQCPRRKAILQARCRSDGLLRSVGKVSYFQEK